ncbi:galectin-3b isoform X1 [Alosa sapidissima]|uniref:galectin-3b isoform X1 n=1 Tax=Alosa sapidissima TaxID=34773 RepID=UPI001C098D7B|nr:galectin-3b isoform X1 [Alosa sapidissima]
MDLSDALGGPWPGQNNQQQSGGPLWPGQPNQPGQPSNPTWPGQPSQPTWPGQPNQPGQPTWPGQPNQPSQPTWPGQPNQPSQPTWPGQPNQPSQPTWPAQPNAPAWPGPSPPTAPQVLPQRPLTVPYDQTLPSGVYDKMLITITGNAKPQAKRITVNLGKGKDIAFHFNPRFDEYGKKVIVRNSLIGSQWGKEERDCPRFPFVAGQPFELKILCSHNEYKVAVNKSHLLEFRHRVKELNMINSLSIYDDVTLTSVNIETLP